MKLRLNRLMLTCRKSVEEIPFNAFNYFYGEMGAGKSTIARLIDYCLGSNQLVMTPALQSEFVSVSLDFALGDKPLTLERARESGQVLATFGDEQVIIPARNAGEPVIPNTQVQVLSDLIFFLQGLTSPKVRRSQKKEESELERLSLRDLLWFCYLDQDSMDSSFFNLDRDADTFRRLKSRNVLRSILGVHQEKVAELEAALEDVRNRRIRLSETAKVLGESLEKAEISDVQELDHRIKDLNAKEGQVSRRIAAARDEQQKLRGHASDQLRTNARQIASELDATENAIAELVETTADDKRHLNEILALSTKVRRLESARAVLNDVAFARCPRCVQDLPSRPQADCPVCGQPDKTIEAGETEGAATEADLEGRVKELQEVLESQATQLNRLRRRRDDLRAKKSSIDESLNEAMAQYDSAYLANALNDEKELAALRQEAAYLQKMKVLPTRVTDLLAEADRLGADEARLRRELRDAQSAAEQDLTNLNRLTKLFLDCLLRARIPGFETDDTVRMTSPWFLPEVIGTAMGDLATTSFSTLGSGGKKNLFKCCFALALHRLAAELDTFLPTLLIIDSPMKNISERENRIQFEGFHQLLYELAQGELADVQFILIDKEFCPPLKEAKVSLTARHMKVDDEKEPPLIRYYRGK